MKQLLNHTVLFIFASLLLAALAAGWSSPALAQDWEEVPGEDISWLPRYPGSVRTEFNKKDFDRYEFTVKFDESEEPTVKPVEGKHYHIVYSVKGNLSDIQIMRNYENALKSKNFKLVLPIDPDRVYLHTITANKAAPNQDIWVSVILRNHGQDEDNNTLFDIHVEMVEVEKMKQVIELGEAQMKKQLDETGRVAVYGINFDTGKATIKPGSEKALSEIGKLLNNNPSLKLSVEGHTDNVGAKDANQKLSEQRAASVKDYLVKNFKVDAARLAAKGFGDSKPLADNSSEDGKAKNRRVELVKI